MGDWQTLSSTDVFENPWFKVRRDEVLNHNKTPLTYGVIQLQHPSVFIIATNNKGEILLFKNYRYTIDKTVWEIPAGHAETDDLLSDAKRELLEETGLESDDWENLGTLYQATGIGNVPAAFFLARNVRSTSDDRDAAEQITEQQFLPLATIEQMALDGQIEETPLLAGIYLAKIRGLTKEGAK